MKKTNSKDIDLFDFIKILFTKPNEYNKLNNYIKMKHFFMVNRFMSIQFPMEAQAFNINGISQAYVMDCWQLVATKYGKVPGWIYTKLSKGAKNKPPYEAKPDAVEMYLSLNEISMREYKDAFKVDPVGMKKQLVILEKQLGLRKR